MFAFLHPWGLLALLSLGAVVLLYFYVFRGRRLEVSALFLWETTESLRREGRRRQRPPLTWPLVLELLAALLLSMLVAGLVYSRVSAHPHAVVILDSSASMNAAEGRVSFRRAAMRKVGDICRGLGRDGRVTLVDSAYGGSILGGEALTPAEAEAALAGWRPGAPDHSFGPAVELGRSLVGQSGGVLLLTDRPVEVEGARVVAVGRPLENTGWVSCHWTGPNELFALARHYGDGKPRKTVVLYGDDAELTGKTVDFGSRTSVPLAFEVPEEVGSLRLELPEDALPNDNVLRLTRPPRPVLPVEVRVPEGRFREALLKALRACRPIRTQLAENAPLLLSAGRPEESSAGRARYAVEFRTPPEDRRRAFAGPFVVDPNHPLTRGAQLQGAVWTADPEFTAEGAGVLISVSDVPLVVSEGRRLVFNLSPEGTNLFRMPAWPVLASNLVEHVYERVPGLKRFSYRLGESLSFFRPDSWEGEVEIRAPDGESTAFEGDHIYYGRLKSEGIYLVRAGGRTVARLDAHLLSAAESDLTAASASDTAAEVEAAELRSPESHGLHREFSLLAAALLLSCWFLLERQRA